MKEEQWKVRAWDLMKETMEQMHMEGGLKGDVAAGVLRTMVYVGKIAKAVEYPKIESVPNGDGTSTLTAKIEVKA